MLDHLNKGVFLSSSQPQQSKLKVLNNLQHLVNVLSDYTDTLPNAAALLNHEGF